MTSALQAQSLSDPIHPAWICYPTAKLKRTHPKGATLNQSPPEACVFFLYPFLSPF